MILSNQIRPPVPPFCATTASPVFVSALSHPSAPRTVALMATLATLLSPPASQSGLGQPLRAKPKTAPVEIERLYRVRPALQNTKSCPLIGSSSSRLRTNPEPIESLAKIGRSNCQYTFGAPAPRLSIGPLPSQCWPARELPAHRILLRLPAMLPLQIPTDNGHALQRPEPQLLQSALLRIGPAFPANAED